MESHSFGIARAASCSPRRQRIRAERPDGPVGPQYRMVRTDLEPGRRPRPNTPKRWAVQFPIPTAGTPLSSRHFQEE
jgi:hypothetical protein